MHFIRLDIIPWKMKVQVRRAVAVLCMPREISGRFACFTQNDIQQNETTLFPTHSNDPHF